MAVTSSPPNPYLAALSLIDGLVSVATAPSPPAMERQVLEPAATGAVVASVMPAMATIPTMPTARAPEAVVASRGAAVLAADVFPPPRSVPRAAMASANADAGGPCAEISDSTLAQLEREATRAEARALELSWRLQDQEEELERLRTAAAAAARSPSHAGDAEAQTSLELPPSTIDVSCAELLPSSPASPPPIIAEGPLDCATLLQHTLSLCEVDLLDAATQRAIETAMHVGALGERGEPADAIWACIIQQQMACLENLSRENRELRAQGDLHVRLSRFSPSSASDIASSRELRRRIDMQKTVVRELLENSAAPVLHGGRGGSSGGGTSKSFGAAASGVSGLQRCDIEEAIARFRIAPQHAPLARLLDAHLGDVHSGPREPALLGALLERDVAASAEVLLLECMRLEHLADIRGLCDAGVGAAVALDRAEALRRRLAAEVEALHAERARAAPVPAPVAAVPLRAL